MSQKIFGDPPYRAEAVYPGIIIATPSPYTNIVNLTTGGSELASMEMSW